MHTSTLFLLYGFLVACRFYSTTLFALTKGKIEALLQAEASSQRNVNIAGTLERRREKYSSKRERITREIEDFWNEVPFNKHQKRKAFVCLSVRTGFDLLLSVLNYPPGSEILMSAVNILHMRQIVEKHGLIPVPIDIDMDDMCPKFDILEHTVGLVKPGVTKALIVAHLLGAQIHPEKIQRLSRFAKSNGLLFIEDCAQIYSGTNGYLGHEESDVSMFSFGTIKTGTAIGGAVLFFNTKECASHQEFGSSQASLLQQVKTLHSTYPVNPESAHFKKLVKSLFLYLITIPHVFGIFVFVVTKILNKNYDDLVIGLVRGFPGDQLLEMIRMQPSYLLLKMMNLRFRTYRPYEPMKRAAHGQYASSLLPLLTPPPAVPAHLQSLQHTNEPSGNKPKPSEEFHSMVIQPGRRAFCHHYWLFPVVVEDPHYFMQLMKEKNFDCTQGASQLSVIPVPSTIPPNSELYERLDPKEARYFYTHLMYLPVYGELSKKKIQQMMQCFVELVGDKRQKIVTFKKQQSNDRFFSNQQKQKDIFDIHNLSKL